MNKLLSLNFGALLDAAAFAAWIVEFRDTIMTILIWVMIVLMSAGSIYAVILGINLAKAENAEKREEAKSRIINAIKGLLILLVLIILFIVISSNIEVIVTFLSGNNTSTLPEGSGNEAARFMLNFLF